VRNQFRGIAREKLARAGKAERAAEPETPRQRGVTAAAMPA